MGQEGVKGINTGFRDEIIAAAVCNAATDFDVDDSTAADVFAVLDGGLDFDMKFAGSLRD